MLMRPWIDYVPIKMDMSDLEEKIEWVRQNDQKARKIAESGKRRVRSLLSDENLACYMQHLLTEYSKLMF